MIQIEHKKDCCGCFACYNICPKNAIKMLEDEKGFKYPEIDREKCVSCGKCKKVCSMLNREKIEREPKAYACINKDEDIRMKSSSGGIFTLLAKYVLDKKGVVFGAVWNEDFTEVNHTFTTKEEELGKFRGSKYLQSNVNDTYRLAKDFLEDGKYVLFTGTPCQISALKKYLNKEYDKLILQDIICHGVPSPLAWKKYQETFRKNRKIEQVDFKNKEDEGWNKYHFKVLFENGKVYNINHRDNLYMKAFLKNVIVREACTECEFKTKDRISDITLADFWGVDNLLPEMNDEKGTSLVIVNSKKGEEIFKEVSSNMIFEKVDLELAVKANPSYSRVVAKGKPSAEFFEKLDEIPFNKLVKKYVPSEPIAKKIINKSKSIVKKLIKK